MDEETIGLPTPNNLIFGEIQVLLAGKRTAQASECAQQAPKATGGNS